MPTYEYRCPEGHEFEAFQKMTDSPTADCPECGAAAERQLSAGAGVIFKGSGFYATDYRGGSYDEAAKAEKKESDTGADASESSDDSSNSSTGD